MGPDTFCNFNLVKNHKIADNSTTAKAREKTNTDLESLESWKFFAKSWQNLKAIKFYCIKLNTDF